MASVAGPKKPKPRYRYEPPVLSQHEIPEVLAPATGHALHVIADNRSVGKPTDQAKVVVGVGADGAKQVLILFPLTGTCYPIRTLSELQKWHDAFGAIIDQIKRPNMEVL